MSLSLTISMMAFRVIAHETYLEVQLFGIVDGTQGRAPQRARLQRARPPLGTKILLDLSDVERIVMPVDRMSDGMARVEALGERMALFAPRADLFGLSRQVLQLGGVKEGFSIPVFKERDLAVAWLLDPSFPSAKAMGGPEPRFAEEVLLRAFLA